MTIDPKLLAEWAGPDGTRMVFQPDSSVYFGAVGVPYSLEDSANILNINNRTYYTRLSGSSPTSIVGHWRDNPNGEEIIFRNDSRYISILDGDPLVYFGNYIAETASLTSYEYRGQCTTDGNQITFVYIFGNSQIGQYTVTEDTLVLQLGNTSISYNKVANPALKRDAAQAPRPLSPRYASPPSQHP